MKATNLVLLAGLMSINLAWSQSGMGNGGSINEADLAGTQSDLEVIKSKIRSFVIKTPALEKTFPEIPLKAFSKNTVKVKIEVVNETVYDKHNKKRTCTNLPTLIKCDIKELKRFEGNVPALYVLMFHELLGTMGLEETSPANPTMIAGYKYSKRLAGFVSRVQNYDLVFNNKDVTLESFAGYYLPIGQGCHEALNLQVINYALNITKVNRDNEYSDLWGQGEVINKERWIFETPDLRARYKLDLRKMTIGKDGYLRLYKTSYLADEAFVPYKLVEQFHLENGMLIQEYKNWGQSYCRYQKAE